MDDPIHKSDASCIGSDSSSQEEGNGKAMSKGEVVVRAQAFVA